jgi:glucose/arabinose dehydrogenase
MSMPYSFHRHVAFAVAAAFAGAMGLAVAAPVAAQVCGDADRNGTVSVTDGVRALRAAAGLADSCEAALCDLDGDGALTVRDGVNVLRLAAELPAFTACPLVPALVLTPIASGLTAPLFVSGAPGQSGRLFVVEQPGRIVIVDDGTVLTRAFLDVTALTTKGGEQGLLGLAFHPDYANNRRFYVYYTNGDGDPVIAEYLRSSGDPTVAEPTATRVLRTIEHPFGNHNGGMLAFGPDGFLYAASGDGGGGGDPNGNGQNRQSKLGKILRLDVDSDVPPPGNLAGADPDVWDFGLRNPFRLSFDRATGDLYIGDVGQGLFEEVDVEPRGQGGKNYGWDVTEGFECFEPQSGCDTTGITFPAVAYAHQNGGAADDCSVIGGYVYRGTAIPALVGRYLYGDICSGRVRSFVWNGSAAVSAVELTTALASNTTVDALASFGEDLNGELYVADLSGTVFRIDPRP